MLSTYNMIQHACAWIQRYGRKQGVMGAFSSTVRLSQRQIKLRIHPACFGHMIPALLKFESYEFDSQHQLWKYMSM